MRVYDAKIVNSLVSLGDDVRLDQPDKVVDYLRSASDETLTQHRPNVTMDNSTGELPLTGKMCGALSPGE